MYPFIILYALFFIKRKNLWIKNLQAEIYHFNIPKNTRTCVAKEDHHSKLSINYNKQFNKGR